MKTVLRYGVFSLMAAIFISQVALLIWMIGADIPRADRKLVLAAIAALGVFHYPAAKYLQIGVFRKRRTLTPLERRAGISG